MSNFTQSEINTICCFFGVAYTPNIHELPNLWFLEHGSVDHPSGDKLEVLEQGIVCRVENQPPVPVHHFQRNLHGLLSALSYITTALQE